MNMTKRLVAGSLGVTILASVLVAAVGAVGGSPAARADGGARHATAVLRNAAGDAVGEARFATRGDKVRVSVVVRDLSAGFHGLHVHAVGSCDPSTATPFSSAGGHLAETSHGHGGAEHAHHAGDMPSLYVSADGTGRLSFLTDRYTVADLFDMDGSALIVHAGADNFANIPTRYAAAPDATTLATGDAGARVACGIIQARS